MKLDNRGEIYIVLAMVALIVFLILCFLDRMDVLQVILNNL